MVNLLLAHRIYELNARVAQTADEMMGLTNALRK
jgi:flagellar basal body rod protein FlgG